MIHHRRVTGGGPSFVAKSHAGNGTDLGTSEAATAALGDGAVGDSMTSSDPALHSGAMRELRKWSRAEGLRRKMAVVAAIGVFALLLAGERLTNVLSSFAQSTPLSRLEGGSAAADWTERVAGCTGPADGFVYGGDDGKVLTFVRRGRGDADFGDPALSDVLRWFWTLKHDRGVLTYKVTEDLEQRREVGSENGWEVVFTRNIGRNKPFPPAAAAEAPWDPSSFNFYKAAPAEFVLSYTPSFRRERDEAKRSEKGVGMMPMEMDAAAAAAAAAAAGAAKAAAPGGASSLGCAEVSTASPPQDAVLVNIRPVGPVSVLLTPGYPHSHNQRARAESLAVAMDFAEALRVDPGFRLGFNSAGSSASVNHLHFQCWYFDAGPGGLAIEASKSVHAATVPLRRRSSAEEVEEEANDVLDVHTLDGYPIRTLVFHTLGKDLEAVGEVIEKCVNFLVGDNTPHTIVFSTGRAFLLPRQHLQEPPFAVVPGFPEVSGEIIVTKEEDFRTITADQMFEWWRDKIGVSAEHFDRITDSCLKEET